MDLKRCLGSGMSRNKNMEESMKDGLSHVGKCGNFQSREEVSNAVLLDSTPNQVTPVVTGMITGSKTTSKDWHSSLTQNLRQIVIRKIIQGKFPVTDIQVSQDKRISNLIAYAKKVELYMYEASNSMEEYHQLLAFQQIIQKELKEKRQKRKEMQMQQYVGPASTSTATPTVVGKSKTSLNEKRSFKIHTRQKLLQIREEIKKINASVKDANKTENFHTKEDKMGIPGQHPVIKRDYGKIKTLSHVSNRLEQFENKLNQVRKILENNCIFSMGHDPHLNKKQTPEVLKLIKDSDDIERRYCLRQEILANRRKNQLKAVNLNRRLVMDEDNQATSRSDSAFNLKSLDEALPPISHCRRAPGIKKRTLRLKDIVINCMKENRLAVNGLCSMDTTTAEKNS